MIGSEGAARLMRVARSRSRASARSDGGQGGFTLIEILVCVALMGTVILALASGMLTLVKTTGATSERQRIQLALGSYTESLKTSPYVPCGDAVAYTSTYSAWPEAWTPAASSNIDIEVTDVEYWDTASTAVVGNAVTGSFVDACPGADQGAQRLTVSVTLPSGRTGTAQVVKDVSP